MERKGELIIHELHRPMDHNAHERENYAYHGDYRFAPKLNYHIIEAFTHVVQDCVTLAITFEHVPSPDSC